MLWVIDWKIIPEAQHFCWQPIDKKKDTTWSFTLTHYSMKFMIPSFFPDILTVVPY